MAFDHMSVTAVEKAHAKRIERDAHHITTMDASAQEKRAKHMRLLDGVMVSKHLANLCEGIRVGNKRLKFAVAAHPSMYWEDNINIIGEAWAYFPGDEYCMMRLGYADYSVRTGSTNKYSVFSRHIRNEKFKEDRDHYYMVMTDSLDRAVKNALKYMRPYGTPEIAGMSLKNFQGQLTRPMWEAANATESALEGLRKHKSFLSEMKALINSAYQFNDPSFGNTVKDVLMKIEARDAKVNVKHHGYYVYVREQMGEQVFDVISLYDLKNIGRRALDEPHQVCNAQQLEELDPELPSKLAALSMLDNDKFVEGLGYKVSATTYWVLK